MYYGGSLAIGRFARRHTLLTSAHRHHSTHMCVAVLSPPDTMGEQPHSAAIAEPTLLATPDLCVHHMRDAHALVCARMLAHGDVLVILRWRRTPPTASLTDAASFSGEIGTTRGQCHAMLRQLASTGTCLGVSNYRSAVPPDMAALPLPWYTCWSPKTGAAATRGRLFS